MSTTNVSANDTMASVSHALFSSTSNALSDSHLCFNKAHFGRTDFNVDRFVNLARRRANLAQIHNDLRVYLKVVQNSMIELINDDYADFVNLSSNLVGLKETIEKLNKDIEVIWNDLCGSTREVMTAAEYIDQQATDLAQCRAAQIDLSAKISLIMAIERLADKISSRPNAVDSFWKLMKPEGKFGDARNACLMHVQKMSEEWLVHDLQGECVNTGALLGILTLIEEIDSAVSRVMTEVIDPKIEKHTADLGLFLDNVLTKMIEMREEWLTKLAKNASRVSTISPFLDKCLLTYVVSLLDLHFGSVLIPSDNRLFHRCCSAIYKFISNWPDASKSRTVLRMIRDRFNLIVYFKLETHQFLSDLNERLDPKAFRFVSADTSVSGGDTAKKRENGSFSLEIEEKVHCECSAIVIRALTSLWSEDIYLPTLLDKFWDFSLKMLDKYSKWLDALLKYFGNGGNCIEGVDTWRALCAVYVDCSTVDARIFELALSSIWTKIRELGLDVTPFGQCLSSFSSRIAKRRKELEDIIVCNIVASLTKVMDGVSDIPRHYRWTKKPHPTEASLYISEAFSVFESFTDEVRERCWADEDIENVSKRVLAESLDAFCVKAEQVLDSVEQTGSSLQRFKRKSATGSADVNAADTDEGKIRSQLILDLNYCRSRACAVEIDVPRIDKLMSRAGSGVDGAIKTGPILSLPDMAVVAE
uniref:Conserved oligomeric Golgi complex subunit 2 n=1 Tax=Ascaris lumbricoides TaxID=6252 RepID=A0A9J2Q1L8_ASCLU